MENTSTTKSLPCDMMSEILAWVPLKSLSVCKCVCKEWQKMIYQSYFINLHSQRTNTLRGYFIQSLRRSGYSAMFVSPNKSSTIPPPSLDFLPKEVKIEASSSINGLLCCTSQGNVNVEYFICKPATKEWEKIPNPRTRYFTERISMVVLSSSPLHYKIIRFSWPKCYKDHLICEIYDSQNQRWKRSSDIMMEDFELLSLGPGVLKNGSFYWLTIHHRIFSFDAEKEKWRMIRLPQQQSAINEDYGIIKKVVKYEGQLSLCYSRDTWIEIWALEDIDREEWERKKIVKKEKGSSTFVDLYLPDVALMFDHLKVNWYDFIFNTSKETQCKGQPREAYSFESDLTPLSANVR